MSVVLFVPRHSFWYLLLGTTGRSKLLVPRQVFGDLDVRVGVKAHGGYLDMLWYYLAIKITDLHEFS